MAIQNTHLELLSRLYPAADTPAVARDAVNYHLLGVLMALATRDDLLAETLPPSGGANPSALKGAKIGLDPSRIPDEAIRKLAKYREHFAGIQRAWLEISGYEDPPCPDDRRLSFVVDATRKV
jgi:hypothetical protein